MKFLKRYFWHILAGLIAGGFLAYMIFAPKPADATYIPEIDTNECVEVSAPDPINFSKKIGIITFSFQWQENPEGTWKLYKDIDPRGGHEYWLYTGDKVVENDCPDPVEPTCEELQNCPVEEPKEEPKGGPSDERFAPSSTLAPVCTNGDTAKAVANPHVIRNGSEATVNFFITEGDSANVFYGIVGQPHWQHAVADVKPNSDNFVSLTIKNLDPVGDYDFGIMQKTNCGGGKITAVIVDSYAPKVFGLSYYE